INTASQRNPGFRGKGVCPHISHLAISAFQSIREVSPTNSESFNTNIELTREFNPPSGKDQAFPSETPMIFLKDKFEKRPPTKSTSSLKAKLAIDASGTRSVPALLTREFEKSVAITS